MNSEYILWYDKQIDFWWNIARRGEFFARELKKLHHQKERIIDAGFEDFLHRFTEVEQKKHCEHIKVFVNLTIKAQTPFSQ